MNSESDFGLLLKYRKVLIGFAALWILVNHEWSPILTIDRLRKVEDFIIPYKSILCSGFITAGSAA